MDGRSKVIYGESGLLYLRSYLENVSIEQNKYRDIFYLLKSSLSRIVLLSAHLCSECSKKFGSCWNDIHDDIEDAQHLFTKCTEPYHKIPVIAEIRQDKPAFKKPRPVLNKPVPKEPLFKGPGNIHKEPVYKENAINGPIKDLTHKEPFHKESVFKGLAKDSIHKENGQKNTINKRHLNKKALYKIPEPVYNDTPHKIFVIDDPIPLQQLSEESKINREFYMKLKHSNYNIFETRFDDREFSYRLKDPTTSSIYNESPVDYPPSDVETISIEGSSRPTSPFKPIGHNSPTIVDLDTPNESPIPSNFSSPSSTPRGTPFGSPNRTPYGSPAQRAASYPMSICPTPLPLSPFSSHESTSELLAILGGGTGMPLTPFTSPPDVVGERRAGRPRPLSIIDSVPPGSPETPARHGPFPDQPVPVTRAIVADLIARESVRRDGFSIIPASVLNILCAAASGSGSHRYSDSGAGSPTLTDSLAGGVTGLLLDDSCPSSPRLGGLGTDFDDDTSCSTSRDGEEGEEQDSASNPYSLEEFLGNMNAHTRPYGVDDGAMDKIKLSPPPESPSVSPSDDLDDSVDFIDLTGQASPTASDDESWEDAAHYHHVARGRHFVEDSNGTPDDAHVEIEVSNKSSETTISWNDPRFPRFNSRDLPYTTILRDTRRENIFSMGVDDRPVPAEVEEEDEDPIDKIVKLRKKRARRESPSEESNNDDDADLDYPPRYARRGGATAIGRRGRRGGSKGAVGGSTSRKRRGRGAGPRQATKRGTATRA